MPVARADGEAKFPVNLGGAGEVGGGVNNMIEPAHNCLPTAKGRHGIMANSTRK
jgi:hypothetical protein